MVFFSSNDTLHVQSLNHVPQGNDRASALEATLSNGVTIVVSVFSIAEAQFASLSSYDKRLMPDGPEPQVCWKLPTHLGTLKAIDVVQIAPQQQLNEWTTGINRLCLATKRTWVNVQELTAMLTGNTK